MDNENKNDLLKETFAKGLSNFFALIKVKSILTLVLTAMFSYMAAKGAIDSKDFYSVFLMIVSFYFGTQSKKE